MSLFQFFFRVLPAFLNDLFGSHNISVCYGLILTAWSLASIFGGFLFTTVFNYQAAAGGGISTDPYPYIINSYWILCCVMIGVLATVLVRTHLKDRLLPPIEGQWFRRRIFNIVVIVKRIGMCPEIEIIGSKKYDEMWEDYLKHRNDLNNKKINTELTEVAF